MKQYFLKNTTFFSLILIFSCQKIVNNSGKENINEVILTNFKTDKSKFPKPKGIYIEASVGCGMQDKAGNIWFGTNGEGLFKYDGKEFHNFTTKEGLDTNIVYSVLEDKSGVIWVGTKTSLNKFDGKSFKKVTISVENGFISQSNPPEFYGVWSMMQDKKGLIWFGTDAGIYCFDGSKFTRFIDNKNLINKNKLHLKSIFSILEDKLGNIWFGSCMDEGISRFDGTTLVNIVPHKDVLRVNNIQEDKKGNLWFSSSFNGVCHYDGKTFTKNYFNFNIPDSGDILKDKSDNFWFNKNQEIVKFDGTTKIYTEKEGVPKNGIVPILEDKSGNIWFSSVGMGLYKFNGKTFEKMSE